VRELRSNLPTEVGVSGTAHREAVQAEYWTPTAALLPSGLIDVNEFDEAVAAWQTLPFPPGSASDAIDELHADLVLADSWVAESVIPYIERGSRQLSNVDVIKRLSEFRSRATELRESSESQEDEQLLDSYREYIDSLLRAYRAFVDLAMPKV